MFIFGSTFALLGRSLRAEAQPMVKVPALGVLHTGVGPHSLLVDVTRQGLRKLGYVDGQIVFEVRFAGGKAEAFPGLAAGLVHRKVDVLLAIGPAAIRAARDATTAIPIVAVDLESDPVAAGFARSLGRPGGNITGCFLDQPGLTGKWLELIREAAPGTSRIAVLVDPTTGPWQLAAIKVAALKLGMELQILEIRGAWDVENALGAGVRGGSRAVVQLSSPLFDKGPAATRVAEFSVKRRLPAISMFQNFPDIGGLMAYGPNQPEYYERLASYIDRILRGAKPGDLPIEQPTKFDLVINLRTAKTLGLTISQSLLQRADQVIE